MWRLDGYHANLSGRDLQGALDLATPRTGVTQLRYRGAAIDGWLLGVDFGATGELEPDDAYVRDNDLVVAYRETAERPFSVQVYWSVGDTAPNGVVALDAIVSIQTRQWEAYPEVKLESAVPNGMAALLEDSSLLLQPQGCNWSYTQASPPGDFMLHYVTARAKLLVVGWTFGKRFMERGVIRRLRVRGALVPREGDQASLDLLKTALQAEQPPLTA